VVESGGSGSADVVGGGGTLNVLAGGAVSGDTVSGQQTVYGSASGTIIASGGEELVASGARRWGLREAGTRRHSHCHHARNCKSPQHLLSEWCIDLRNGRAHLAEGSRLESRAISHVPGRQRGLSNFGGHYLLSDRANSCDGSSSEQP
jgi:autotransporter passenger strand-loop-strand repeat protein